MEPLSLLDSTGDKSCNKFLHLQLVGIIAPLPSDETVESPIVFVAVTLAATLTESPRLKGEDRKLVTGIVQLLADYIDELVSASQFVRSFSKVAVDVLISTL